MVARFASESRGRGHFLADCNDDISLSCPRCRELWAVVERTVGIFSNHEEAGRTSSDWDPNEPLFQGHVEVTAQLRCSSYELVFIPH